MLPSRRPTRRPLTALAALVAAATLALSACSGGTTTSDAGPEGSDAPTGSSSAERVVATDQGDVTVPTDPQRVVVLNHALAGYLYALDVPVLATVPEVTDDPEPAFSPLWAQEAEADGTELLEWSADGFNLEAILALEPDLIVGGGWGFPLKQATDVYDGLSQIAPTVLVSGTYTTWQEQLAFLAEDVFDDAATYEELAAGYEDRLAEVRDAITVPAGETAFLARTAEGTTYALQEGEGLPAIFERLGFAVQPIQEQTGAEPYTPGGDMFEVSAEQVTSVVTAPNVFVIGFNGAEVDLDALAADPVFAALPSFAAGTAHELPTWTIRSDYHEAMALLDVVEEQFSLMAQHRLRTHPLVLRRVEVARVVDVTPRMRRVTLVGPELGAFERDGLPMPAFDAPGFDDHVKLVLASDGDVASALPVQRAHGIDWPPAPNRQGRDYTPRRWDPVAGELDLDLVLHGDGPAAAWAGAARPGDALWFVGPKASTVWPDDVDWALLAGDETALPAIGRFLDERPVDAPVQVVVTVGDASARQDLALRDGDTVRWVVAPEGDRGALGEAVRAITWWPGRVYAWAASESRALLPVRRHLTRERGAPRTHVDVTGYWHAQPAPSGARPGGSASSTVGDTSGGVPGSTASDVPGSTATGTVPAAQPAGVPSPVPWFATRAALQLGLLDALGDGPRDVAALADAARVAPAAVRVLVDVLTASGVVTSDGDKVALADAGEDLLDDEHAREEYEGLEADAVLALAALAPALREDAPAWARSRGRTLRAEVEADADLAAEVVEGADVLPYVLTGLPTWPVWSGAQSVAVGGPGALVVADLLADVPGDRTTTLVEDPVPLAVLREQAGTGSPHATSGSWPGADLAVCALGTGHRTDDEVVALLAAMGAAARRAVLVEDLTPDGLSPHAHEHALLSLATTGSGPRTPDDVARLAARAGWRVVGHDALGWGVARVELAR